MVSCQACKTTVCISQLGVFSTISRDHHDQIVSSVVRRAFKKGELVVTQDSPLSQFVVVSSGTFKCYTNHEDGKQKTLYYLHKGDFFGQSSLFNESTSPYSVEALENSTVCMLDAKTIQNLIINDHQFALSIVGALSVRIQDLENELSKVSIDPLELRLLSLLHVFAQDFGVNEDDGIHFRLPLTQEELGMRLGVTRESISRTLKQLESQGKIEMLKHKRIKIKRM